MFLGALRSPLRLPLRPILTLSAYRIPPPLSASRHQFALRLTIQCQNRSISIGSLFSFANKSSSPSPLTVATISRIEADANANSHDVGKQLSLFQALVDSGVKPGYEIVVSRWERMCTFDPASPLLRSDTAFQLYLTALIKSGHQSSVNAAARRRDTLLSTTPLSPDHVTANSATPLADPSKLSDSTPTSAAEKTPHAYPPTSSQHIAQTVLAAAISNSLPLTQAQSPDMSRLQAAFRGVGGVGIQGNPLVVTVSEPASAIFLKIVRFVVTTGIGLFLVVTILAVLIGDSGLMKQNPRSSLYEPQEGRPVKFSDVYGIDEAKEELKDIVGFLRDPSIYASLGGKLPKGVLLTGPPGTGKTMLAKAVAGEAGVPFFFASGSEFDEVYVGVGAKRVRDIFAAARSKQPSIIFIDELDAVGGRRNSRDNYYQTLNQLLVEMDGFSQGEGVIVIAATNFPENLDGALVRPGRFDKHIAVPLPDIRGRVQILQHYVDDVKASKDVDLTSLGRGTSGLSGADLQNLVNEAAIQAGKEGAREVLTKHFEWARDRIMMGSERKSAYINEEEKLAIAYHEGGHTIVNLYTEGSLPLYKVTCVPRGHSLGMTRQQPEKDTHIKTLKEYIADIDLFLGGRAAEVLRYGPQNATNGCSSDFENATHLAKLMVKHHGFSTSIGPVYYGDDDSISPETKAKIDEEVRSLLVDSEKRVMKLLKEKEEELHLLAHALVEHETLDAEEVKRVIKGLPIRGVKEKVMEAQETAIDLVPQPVAAPM